MSQKLNSAVAVIGIDIGKNSFHTERCSGSAALSRAQAWACEATAKLGIIIFQKSASHVSIGCSRDICYIPGLYIGATRMEGSGA